MDHAHHPDSGKHYVVSQDIQLLLAPWAEARGFTLPSDRFFVLLRQNMQQKLEEIFPDLSVVSISEAEIKGSLEKMIASTGDNPLVNMDKVYYESGVSLEVTRLVDKKGTDLGLGSRNTKPIGDQIGAIEKIVEGKPVRLVDDVIFNGGTIIKVVKLLNAQGIHVSHIIAGIMMNEGDTPGHIARECRPTNGGLEIEILCGQVFMNFKDEICERDFYAGVPQSGKLIGDAASMVATQPEEGRPYFNPFGDPKKGASIEGKHAQREWSIFCLEQSILLWKAIEESSGKQVLSSDLTRLPQGIPRNHHRFVPHLVEKLEQL